MRFQRERAPSEIKASAELRFLREISTGALLIRWTRLIKSNRLHSKTWSMS